MQGDIKAPRGKSTHDRVSTLKLTAAKDNEVDQLKLALIASAMFPITDNDHDKMFELWLKTRIRAYCKANNVHIHRG